MGNRQRNDDIIPEGIERSHVLKAIAEFDRDGLPEGFKESHTYDLHHDGRRYPPPAILALAARRVTGEDLPPRFRAGEGTKCFEILRGCGFTILGKDDEFADERYIEGAVSTRTITSRGRSPSARQRCIEHFGARCFCCGMKFSELYGPDVGGDFIHVHHREPIAEASGEYIVDPVRDLVPVCPNCHYMLHTDAPPLRPEFLRDIVEARRLPADGQSLPES